MAAEFAELALEGVPYVAENYEKAWDPARDNAKRLSHQVAKKFKNRDGDRADDSDYSTDEHHRYNGRRSGSRPRSGRGDIVETRRVVRTTKGRARSAGRDGRDYRRRPSRRDYSDSESSISPPPRRSKSKRRQSLGDRAMAALGLGTAAGAAVRSRHRPYSSSRSRSRDRRRDRSRRRSRSADYDRRPTRAVTGPTRGFQDNRTPARYRPQAYGGGQSERGGGGGSQAMTKGGGGGEVSTLQSDDLSSSDICSSSEDERRTRKQRGKEWVTAGLATIATIHAAHGVYTSMEARDKRVMEVMKGEMTPEEARKKKNKARLQDAAAIGVAALGIKGAYSEWQEVQESRQQLEELKKEKARRHEKRERFYEKYGYYPSSKNAQIRGRNASEPDVGGRRRERSV